MAIENADFEVLDVSGERTAGLDKIWQSLVDHGVGADVFGNLLLSPTVGNQFLSVRQVDTVNVGISIKIMSLATGGLGV